MNQLQKNRTLTIAFLTAMGLVAAAAVFVPEASAQSYTHQGGVTTSRFPVYERVAEPQQEYCRDVVVDSGYNPGGLVIGAVVGYAIGREYDRGRRSYPVYGGHRGYERGRGGYYRDNGYYGGRDRYDSRVGRYAGTVGGAYIGSTYGRSAQVTRVCEPSGYPMYREVLSGYRIVVRQPGGSTTEYFEPAR